ncbi:zf-HC2 domain-containing protein [Streptomyces sp. B-S-A8]|uniref:Zf-HC2 domain-containing protein n=1 Tax=Streptomyces solicavernae TaxID=3043614 RepID=A0ABT6RNZ2_9ACTN|nr:zf-HC2 domain-containing protein [Streptomyces sp. B-S-A8]MDI3385493.1 zf-HC2 domain-containing protein [Streptomyces sp. B-S-A8]
MKEQSRQQHEELRTLLGAYVLGGLGAGDRERLESHLARCDSCREELSAYAVLPGLLHQAGPPPEAVPPPESTWEGLVATARAERAAERTAGRSDGRSDARRGRWGLRPRLALAAAAAAAGLVIGGGTVGVVGLGGDHRAAPAGPGPDGEPLTALAGSPASGHGSLEARAWGTEVALHVEDLPTGEHFVAWVVDRDGRREQAAVWSSTPNGSARLRGASSIPRDRVATLRVTTRDGKPLLEMRP